VNSLKLVRHKHATNALVWNLLVRTTGLCVAVLLVAAYFTGDEFVHTHQMIGYGLAAVVLCNLYWELVRPHAALHPPMKPANIGQVLRTAFLHPASLPAFIVVAITSLMVLAFATLLLAAVVHTLSPAVNVDEVHEFVAYFVLGLVILHIAGVFIASAEHLEHRLSNLFGKVR
jgi:cytochrome b